MGLGPGNSRQRNFLPQAYNDFIYSIIIEEYGLLGGAFIIFIYLLFLFRCIRIFRRCPYAFGAFLALGLSFTLVIQAVANMAVNVNLVPVTGVTLPLVSMGGSSFLFTCCAIGLILSVARNVEQIEGKEPIMNMGQVRWYKKINPDATYIVSLDPCLGTGGDYAGLEVLEIPGFHQVAEWHHNTTPIQSQVRILRDICRFIADECERENTSVSLYYSVENNSVGEAALVAINELGEETYPGMFLSEPIKKGHVRRYRKGFNTTHKSKLAIAAKLKQLIESRTLKIYSKPLISQLKSYVAKGLSFEAKTGEHDDLVASLLLNIRMVMMLQDWDPSIYEKMHEHVSEELILPMPIYFG